MFDIGFAELLLIGVVGLIVIGPKRLPETIRTLALWLGRARRTYSQFRRDLEQEIGADEIRRELHNEAIMAQLKETQDQINQAVDFNASSSNNKDDEKTDTSDSAPTSTPSAPEQTALPKNKNSSPDSTHD